ncbi:MAG TPA: hypothetical protein ENN65_03580 [Candidatus Hydrogenedentes bacterium]|nr:hypothetical protein [Candidatus Hydrogenedentota bacterium]
MSISPEEMREIFQHTTIVRRPTYGIVRGYHELPYICLGASLESGYASTRVRGRVQVSPQFVIRPQHYAPRYEDVFGEENVDAALLGRMFGVLGFKHKPVECSSEFLDVRHLSDSVEEALSASMDELDRMEDITTGVIITPNSRYYLVSIERFIASVLEDEFSM